MRTLKKLNRALTVLSYAGLSAFAYVLFLQLIMTKTISGW